jgi:hypothetical protein
MKKVILGSVFAVVAAVSVSANAAETKFCDGGGAGNGLAPAPAATTNFVKIAFTPKCSANVYLVGNDRSATLYTVGSSSIKGKSFFGGSSAGGAVGNLGECTGSPPKCAYTNAQSGSDTTPSS